MATISLFAFGIVDHHAGEIGSFLLEFSVAVVASVMFIVSKRGRL